MKTSYANFLSQKTIVVDPCGKDIADAEIHESLFPFQRAITRWALRRGRAAIFADTGLGKTRMQIEWARLTGEQSLIVAPLSVARQTVREAAGIGVDVAYSRDGSLPRPITITNYEMVGEFEKRADIKAIVLDESSILKSIDGKTKAKLIRQFKHTPWRLCCTATPAPNDISEIANHAEFLGFMNRAKMLGTFFVNNSNDKIHGGWRLKGHAESAFYRWLASWGMSVKKPSDIGFLDAGYDLPLLNVVPVFVKTDYVPNGEMFFTQLKGITDRANVRRETLADRVHYAAALVNRTRGQWIVWCGMNEESKLIAEAIPGAVEVNGSMPIEEKISRLEGFQDRKHRVLVTKPKIAGHGMNFQNCNRMVFVGLSDSWESYYQSIRRCYRFGQKKKVEATIVLSEPERAIYSNVMRKEREAREMSNELIKHVRDFERQELTMGATAGEDDYSTREVTGDGYRILLGDATEELGKVETDSVALSVFSPPFATLFSYSDKARDLGNSGDYGQFFDHFSYIVKELARVTMPGRNLCCHCQQIPRTKVYDGVMGIRDFRGDLIRAFEAEGWTYYGEVCIDKDPQAQAIRTKAKGLLFVTKERDSGDLRPAFADYVLLFKAPGENKVPIKSDITNDEWIEWARPIWYNIRETETLQYRSAREERDEKHICPLQLETVLRCVRLWSNKGETVLSPFMGIGSEGYVSVKHGRRFVGIELKESYFSQAARNLEKAIHDRTADENDLLALMNWKPD